MPAKRQLSHTSRSISPFVAYETRVQSEIHILKSGHLSKTPTKATDKELNTLIRCLSDKSVSRDLAESVFSNLHKIRLEMSGDNYQNRFYGSLTRCFKRTLRPEFKSNFSFTYVRRKK